MGALADFAYSLQMRDTIDRMVGSAIDKMRPRYRYGVVESIDRVNHKCAVVYNGETGSVLVNMGAIQPATVGQIVRIEGIGTDKYITDVVGGDFYNPAATDVAALSAAVDASLAIRQAQHLLIGGGAKSVDSSRYVNWTFRFLAISMARDPVVGSLSGYFEISMPPVGTVIPIPGSATTVTVNSSGIQLPVWGTLWYELPIGETYNSEPGNFHITMYNATNEYRIPDNWVMVCTQHNDTGSSAIKWGDGSFSDYYRALSLSSGWIPHNASNPQPSYRKIGNQVQLHGLLKKSTAPAAEDVMATLPVGYRPVPGISGLGQVHFLIDCANADGGIGISSAGLIVYKAGSNLWMSLDNVRFEAEG